MSTFSGSISSLATSIMINPYDVSSPFSPLKANDIPRAIKDTLREPPKNKEAKFAHDFEKVRSSPVSDWIKSWISDIIRANNWTLKTVMITVGIGKTTRLLKMRSDFRLLDEKARSSLGKAYSKSKNRLILLDNEVSTISHHFIGHTWPH